MSRRRLAGLDLGRTPREVVLQRTRIAGLRHHPGERLWRRLGNGEPLQLRREPDNPHDPLAVALYWRGIMLGYLPRRENLVAARMLDHQRCLQARVIRVLPDSEVRIELKMAA